MSHVSVWRDLRLERPGTFRSARRYERHAIVYEQEYPRVSSCISVYRLVHLASPLGPLAPTSTHVERARVQSMPMRRHSTHLDKIRPHVHGVAREHIIYKVKAAPLKDGIGCMNRHLDPWSPHGKAAMRCSLQWCCGSVSALKVKGEE